MKTPPMMLALAILTLPLASASAPKDKAKCDEVKDQIRAIEAKMRRGYTAAQGIRYEERLKRLKDKRYEVCR